VRTTGRRRVLARPVHRGRVAPARRSALRPEPRSARHCSAHCGARALRELPEAANRRAARLFVQAALAAVRRARHSAARREPHSGARALPGLLMAANRRAARLFVQAALAAVRQVRRSAPPGAAARQAAVQRRAGPAASDAAGLPPGAADAAEAPRAAPRAEAAQGARRAVEVPRAVRDAEARPGALHAAEVRPAGAEEARDVAAPGAPARLSGVASVFRRDLLRRLAPSRQARFARATARWRSASLSRQSWQAARDEVWS
jgi:hypothetical protein